VGPRIIGGDLKGRKLYTARGNIIRPTGNRQREAIFNILSHRVREASVLDLFAGTGAFGIEALSRGARFAVFIDNNKTVLPILEKNIRSCRLEDKSKIFRWNIQGRMDFLQSAAFSFDLVFMDPPYNNNYVTTALNNLHLSCCLQTGADIVVEHASAEPIPDKETVFTRHDQRQYGKTLVSFLTYMV